MNNFKEKTNELKKNTAPVVVILLAVLAFVQIYFTFYVFPPVNDECLWEPKYVKPDSAVIIFKDVKKDGVTWNAGIRDNDTLISVDGEKANSLIQMNIILSDKNEGDIVFYKVKHGEKIFEAPVLVKKLIPIKSLTIEIFALIWLIVGYIVYISKPNGEIQSEFFSIGIFWTLANNSIFIQLPQYVNNLNNLFFYIINFSWVFGVAFLPISIFDFFLTFPEKKKLVSKRFYKLIKRFYPIIIVLAYVLLKVLVVPPTQDLKMLSELIVYSISYIILSIAFITGFFSLLISYRKIKDSEKKKPLRIIVFAYAISLLSAIYVFVLAPVIVGIIYVHPEYYIPVVFMAVLPIAFGYTIFKYSFMDVSTVVKNAFLYFVASLIIAGIYFFSIVIIGSSFINAVDPIYQGLIIGLLFVLFVILFQSTKDKFQEIITRKFYPEQYTFKEALIRFGREIPIVLSFESVLDKTEKIFTETLNISPFALAIYNEKKDRFDLVKNSGLNNLISISFVKDNYQQNEIPFVIENPEEFFNEAQKLKNSGIQLLLKLSLREKLLGFILLGVKQSGTGFTTEEISILSAAANQVAIALENARLHEAEKKEIILYRDLEKARLIQRSLLPQKMPEYQKAEIFGEMLPAQWVGGDYYDVIPIDENRFYAVIGDVSGKGFSASFYMSKLQTIIRLLAKENLQPKELLKKLNRTIYPSLEKNYFITLSLILFDFEQNKAIYSRAGHTPLKVYCCGKIENYAPNGIAVGLDDGSIFDENIDEVELKLKEDEIFVLYSDGVTEEMNAKGELLGDKFMDEILLNYHKENLKIIWNKFYNKITNFENNNVQHDDITYLLIKIKK